MTTAEANYSHFSVAYAKLVGIARGKEGSFDRLDAAAILSHLGAIAQDATRANRDRKMLERVVAAEQGPDMLALFFYISAARQQVTKFATRCKQLKRELRDARERLDGIANGADAAERLAKLRTRRDNLRNGARALEAQADALYKEIQRSAANGPAGVEEIAAS